MGGDGVHCDGKPQMLEQLHGRLGHAGVALHPQPVQSEGSQVELLDGLTWRRERGGRWRLQLEERERSKMKTTTGGEREEQDEDYNWRRERGGR